MPKKNWKLRCRRDFALVCESDGGRFNLPLPQAHRLVASGGYELLSRKPVVLREISFRRFAAELKAASGVLVNKRRREHMLSPAEKRRFGLPRETAGKPARVYRVWPPAEAISDEEREFRRYKNGYLARDGREGERAAQDVVEQVRGKKKGRRR